MPFLIIADLPLRVPELHPLGLAVVAACIVAAIAAAMRARP